MSTLAAPPALTDPTEFEAVVRTHIGKLLVTARRLLRDPAAADDAVQEAFLSAFRNAGSYRSESRVGTWLHRITINACLASLRRRRPFDLVDADAEVEQWLPRFLPDGHRLDAAPPWTESVEELLVRETTRAMVRRAIDNLPEPHRSILVLRDLEELSTSEAAEALQLSQTAVKVRLHRARQALRAMLQEEKVQVLS